MFKYGLSIVNEWVICGGSMVLHHATTGLWHQGSNGRWFDPCHPWSIKFRFNRLWKLNRTPPWFWKGCCRLKTTSRIFTVRLLEHAVSDCQMAYAKKPWFDLLLWEWLNLLLSITTTNWESIITAAFCKCQPYGVYQCEVAVLPCWSQSAKGLMT